LVEEREELERFVEENADSFTLMLKEVILIPGAILNLNIPENTTFNLQVHQCPLTPEQSKFYNEWVNDMITAGIIEQALPELIQCTPTTVIVQRAHETGGLPWEELKQQNNDQHQAAGLQPAYELPPQEIPAPMNDSAIEQELKKWRICQNFAQLCK
jgi:hypothetical protein